MVGGRKTSPLLLFTAVVFDLINSNIHNCYKDNIQTDLYRLFHNISYPKRNEYREEKIVTKTSN